MSGTKSTPGVGTVQYVIPRHTHGCAFCSRLANTRIYFHLVVDDDHPPRQNNDMDSSRHRSRHSHPQGSSSPSAPAATSRRHRHHRATSAHHESRPHRQKRPHSPSPPPPATVRPFKAPELSKHSYDAYREVFADYLDIQKGLILADLDRAEVKGRFKSFVKH